MTVPTQTREEASVMDQRILSILLQHQGKANSIDRWDLVEMILGEPVPADQRNDSHRTDRLIRYSVARLRIAGHLILDLGDGSGRYMAGSAAEFWEFYGYYVEPIKTRAEVIRSMKKTAEERWPDLAQPSLFDINSLEIAS
jgi:hypothetical protein